MRRRPRSTVILPSLANVGSDEHWDALVAKAQEKYAVVPDPAPTKPNDTESSDVTDGWREVLDKWFNAAVERDKLHWFIDDSTPETRAAGDGKYDGVMNAWLEQARNEPRVAPVGIEAPLGALLDEVERVMLERHAKYGPRNISNSPGGPLNGLRVRLHDKQARVNNYVDNKAPADFDDDSLRDAFVDIVGYGLIGLLFLDGSWPE